jgi:Domain of unknown function (DUF5658)
MRQRRLGTSVSLLWAFWLTAFVLEGFDLVSALHMVAEGGIRTELNPLMRFTWLSYGPAGVEVLKLGLALAALGLLLSLGATGRTRLARNSLVLACNIAAIGVLSNGGFHALVPT